MLSFFEQNRRATPHVGEQVIDSVSLPMLQQALAAQHRFFSPPPPPTWLAHAGITGVVSYIYMASFLGITIAALNYALLMAVSMGLISKLLQDKTFEYQRMYELEELNANNTQDKPYSSNFFKSIIEASEDGKSTEAPLIVPS